MALKVLRASATGDDAAVARFAREARAASAREITVEFLTREDLLDYLALEFPGHSIAPDLVDLIHARAAENAPFTADLVRHLKDRSVVTLHEEAWAVSQSVAEIARELPESSRSMIERATGSSSGRATRVRAGAVDPPPPRLPDHRSRFETSEVARAGDVDSAYLNSLGANSIR